MKEFFKKLYKNFIHSLKLVRYLFTPKTVFLRRFSHGLGDNLLLSSVLPKMRDDYEDRTLIVETEAWPELFYNNPYVDWVTFKHFKTTKRHIKPKYHIDPDTEDSIQLQIAREFDLDKQIFPKLYLKDRELEIVKNEIPLSQEKPSIVICPQGKTEFYANRKEWSFEKFQKLVERNQNKYQWLQIGLPQDKDLNYTKDTKIPSIRKTAALISLSDLFVGQEGGMMHLARAVSTPGVVIYGGALRPEITGYENNNNIYKEVDCSPCVRSDTPSTNCDSKKCMEKIKVSEVENNIKNKIKEVKH